MLSMTSAAIAGRCHELACFALSALLSLCGCGRGATISENFVFGERFSGKPIFKSLVYNG
jgi:hypothetical protein